MPLFKPDYYVKSFKTMDLDRLKQKGIRLLLCDIDNTLAAFDDPAASIAARRFIWQAETAGIQVALMSNNVKKRTESFARNLGAKRVYSFSLKPFPFTFWRAMRDYRVSPKQTAILGDQLFTDLLGGKLSGIYTVLSDPVSQRERPDTSLMRFLEGFVNRNYEKRNVMKRGEYDD
ncbi:MAG: YqeG family HAD IIIA-type phosphatase [Erysipelotrichaceae bacterium]|nr:YqeG family HAD IIIA-type phosphatase [Erysipelotrichaceae bacterium]